MRKKGFAAGVSFDKTKGASYIPVTCEDDILKTKNSKYVFSDTDGIYTTIHEKLNSDPDSLVLFIELPCQVAGLLNYLRKPYSNLVTVDIICHGLTPFSYLSQHISKIENKCNSKLSSLSFRDPEYYTYTFTFRDASNKIFYKQRSYGFDNYQLGYHRALTYRNNCYQCNYAMPRRVSDLTIGDFSGLGSLAPFSADKINVSCVLCNTDKGVKLIDELSDLIEFQERPMGEATRVERQLQSPSIPHKRRMIFVDRYARSKDFAYACSSALRNDKIGVLLRRGKWKGYINNTAEYILPKSLCTSLKSIYKRIK